MTGNVNIPLIRNPSDPQQQQQAMAFMRAQLLAQQFSKSGEMPADNEMAGNVVVRHSPLEYLSRAISQGQATQQQMNAYKQQLQMMGQPQTQSGAQAGTAGVGAGNAGLTQDQQYNIARTGAIYGEVAAKALADSYQSTPDMKNASASGVATPLDYNAQSSLNTARANAGMKPATYTTPDGRTMQTTDAGLAGMVSGNGSVPPMNLGGSQKLPLNAINNAMGGMGNPDAMPSGNPSGAPPAIPNGSPVPPVAGVDQGAQLPAPPVNPALAPYPGFKDPITPPVSQPAQTPQPSFGQAVQNAQQSMGSGGGMQVQSPAQAAGATEAQKNYQSYIQGLNKKVSTGATNVRFTNDEEDMLAHFRPGAGEEELAEAAAAAKRLGASDDLVNKIAGGDQSAVSAVQSFASMQAMHGAEQSLEMLSNGGDGQPRIAASVLDSFTKRLADPNQQEAAIRAINAVTRQLYQADYAEQQAALKDKEDPTTFQQRYAQKIQPGLMAGRSSNPAQAVLPATPASQSSASPMTKVLNGVTYTKVNGQWMQ